MCQCSRYAILGAKNVPPTVAKSWENTGVCACVSVCECMCSSVFPMYAYMYTRVQRSTIPNESCIV